MALVKIVTTKQVDFLRTLIAERELPYPIDPAHLTSLERRAASRMIGDLLRAPRRTFSTLSAGLATPTPATEDPRILLAQERAVLLTNVDRGFFAFGEDADMRFYQVRKQYRREGREIVGLRGAPGGFWRFRPPVQESVDVLKQILKDPFEPMLRFGEHYAVCGRCAAELTDATSRQRKFGPDCWGQMKNAGIVR